jgi:hypothetical protein
MPLHAVELLVRHTYTKARYTGKSAFVDDAPAAEQTQCAAAAGSDPHKCSDARAMYMAAHVVWLLKECHLMKVTTQTRPAALYANMSCMNSDSKLLIT